MKIKCDYCGKELNRTPRRIKRNKHHFCNKDHHYKWQREQSLPLPPSRTCPDCGGSKSSHAKRCWQCHLIAPREKKPGPAPKILPLEVLQPFLDAEIASGKIAKELHVNPRVIFRSLKHYGIERNLCRRPCSEEQKRVISKANKGKKRSPEFCRRMSKIAKQRTGEANPFYGKHHSPETRREQSLIKAGKIPNWHRGIYYSPIAGEFKYQSSFELRFAQVLDTLNWQWGRNHDRFEYVKAGGIGAFYAPDFKVQLDGQIRYFETKGYFPESAQLKVQQAQKQAPIIVLTLPLIEMFERYAKSNP